jgi:hypothetical protein
MAVSMGIYDKLIEAVTDCAKASRRAYYFFCLILWCSSRNSRSFLRCKTFTADLALTDSRIVHRSYHRRFASNIEEFRGAKINFGHVVIFISILPSGYFYVSQQRYRIDSNRLQFEPYHDIQLFAVGMIAPQHDHTWCQRFNGTDDSRFLQRHNQQHQPVHQSIIVI